MVGVLSAPDAVVIAALLAAVGSTVGAWVSAYRAAKQTRPNGGSSMRDAIDRIEAQLRDVVTRLDRGAAHMAEHDDRLAVMEARDPSARTRSTDTRKDPQ